MVYQMLLLFPWNFVVNDGLKIEPAGLHEAAWYFLCKRLAQADILSLQKCHLAHAFELDANKYVVNVTNLIGWKSAMKRTIE